MQKFRKHHEMAANFKAILMGHKTFFSKNFVFPPLILANEMARSGWAFGTVQKYPFCTADMYFYKIARAMQYNKPYFTLQSFAPSPLDQKAKLASPHFAGERAMNLEFRPAPCLYII
jgi:hypothetical protein